MAICSPCLAAKVQTPAAHAGHCWRTPSLQRQAAGTLSWRENGTFKSDCRVVLSGVSALRVVRRSPAVLVLNSGAEAVKEEKPNVPLKSASDKCVLVAGAAGGVGQLVVAALLERGIQTRALVRDAGKARLLFGETFQELTVHIGDLRQPEQLSQSLFEGVTHVICCTGTTAFPSRRWDGGNGPQNTDWIGVRNLIAAVPKSVQRVVLVSSIGVTKYNELPWNIMNLFGVLNYKRQGEKFLESSGLPYTIIRPGRLIDGPYTAYDLATLLQTTSGTRRAVRVGQGDKLVGDASRIVVAEACVQALDLDITNNQAYEINSVEGDGPGKDLATWEQLFKSAHS